jgi:Fic family protein
MQELCQDIKNDSRDTISQVAKIHAQFEKVHPFSDGNGRIGRLLMHAMLLRNNIPPVLIKQQEKQIYYTVLSKAQTSPDSSLLEDFILDSLLYSFEILDQE